jgi:NDP-sugar pyrophosphorylase family protein
LQAVILVGGEGTRLRPLTYGTPKPMVPLFGVPFLERALWRLRDAGVDEVVLAAGYMPQPIVDYFGDGSRVGMRLAYVVEDKPLGTAGAIRNVADHLRGTFLVLNGDVLTSLDLRAMLAFHTAHGGLGTLHTIRVDDPSQFGCIVRDGSDRVTAFIEKPKREEAPTNEINAGTYLLEREILDAIPAGRSVSIERETFPALLAAGRPLYSYVTNDYWLDLGRPQQYRQAHDDVLDGKLVLDASGAGANGNGNSGGRAWHIGEAGLPANLRPPVYIGSEATIDPSAVVGPYAILGNGCTIGPAAHVRFAVLWDGVRVESGARVSEAILASNARVGHDAVVEAGAVIGHDAAIEPGTVLEPDARIAAPSRVPEGAAGNM